MQFPPMPIDQIQDYPTQKSVQVLRDWVGSNSPLAGFKLFEVAFTQAVANFKYPHKLGFQPKDVITTSLIGAGAVTFNYSKFDSTNLDITVTGPCTVRFLAGTYQGAL
jgi:hypothetical protein